MRLLALLLLALPAMAHDAILTWSHPTQYEDGQPLAITDIRETLIEYGRCVDQAFPPQPEGSLTVPAPAAQASIAALQNGWWCFRAYTISTEGVQSDASSTAVIHFVGKPKPPEGLAIATAQATGAGRVQ